MPMTEDELRDITIPVRTFADSLLRVMVLEHGRRAAMMRGLTDSRPHEPWRICSPEELKGGRLRMLERLAKQGETARQTARRIEAEQWERGKRGKR